MSFNKEKLRYGKKLPYLFFLYLMGNALIANGLSNLSSSLGAIAYTGSGTSCTFRLSNIVAIITIYMNYNRSNSGSTFIYISSGTISNILSSNGSGSSITINSSGFSITLRSNATVISYHVLEIPKSSL